MSKYIPGNHKHLTPSDRFYIERALNDDISFKEIARCLCKDPSTISKEIRAHRLSDFYPGRGLFLNAKNFCVHRFHCQKKNVCGKIILCDIKCASCPSCNQHCKNFAKEQCSRLDRAPYVCNGCDEGHAHCTIPIIITMMHFLQIADTGRPSGVPDPSSISPGRSSTALIRLLPL